MDIQFVDLQRQYQDFKDAISSQIREVLDSCRYIMGQKVEELERRLAEFVCVPHAVGVSSGTTALSLALMARDIGPGDEVITTPFTFIATAGCIALRGARPVFADIREDTYNIDPGRVEEKITASTRAIIAVDIFGHCADYDRIDAIAAAHGLTVIQDAAQSLGALYHEAGAGSQGEIACTSFYPAKSLGCYGDGGMIFTRHEETAEVLRSLRNHGQDMQRYAYVRIGTNARLNEIQAAVLLAKLPAFPAEIEARRRIADYYTENLKDVATTPAMLPGNRPVYAYYCIRVPGRDSVRDSLRKAGIPTAVYYPRPLHLQEAFRYLGYKEGDFPVAEAVSKDILALPVHPYLEREAQDFIIEELKRATR